MVAVSNLPVQLYPNPVQHTLYVQNMAEGAVLKLTDVTGSVLYQQKTSGTLLQIDMSNYSPGVYMAEIIQGTQVSTAKVIR